VVAVRIRGKFNESLTALFGECNSMEPHAREQGVAPVNGPRRAMESTGSQPRTGLVWDQNGSPEFLLSMSTGSGGESR
jgi:hypothetical protein